MMSVFERPKSPSNRIGRFSRIVEGGSYLSGVDGLRAVAVLMVMIYHLTPHLLPGGFIGVDVFFVISGFVVTGSLLRERALPMRDFLSRFYARRFRRIIPALVICMMATVICSVAVVPDAWLSDSLRDTGLAAFFGLSNIVLSGAQDGYFAPRTEFNPYAHTWSLGVEEQFYLCFPLLLWAITALQAKIGIGPAATASLWIAVLFGSLIWSAWSTFHYSVEAYFLLPSRFWELGVGAVLCIIGPEKRCLLWRRLALFKPAFAGLLLLVVGAFVANRQTFPFPWALLPVIGTTLLICGLEQRAVADSLIGGVLGNRYVVAIGLLSYSLYLWHWPVYTLMRWTAGLETPIQLIFAIFLTSVLAIASYMFVELPGQRISRLRLLPPVMTIAVGFVLMIGGYLLADQWYYRHWLFKHTVVAKYGGAWYAGGVTPASFTGTRPSRNCHLETRRASPGVTHVSVSDCETSQDPLRVKRIHVLGDSHAGAYGRLFAGLATHEGVNYSVYSKGGCAVAPLIARGAPDEACVRFISAAQTQILRTATPGDIVFLASLRLPRLSDQDGRMVSPVPSVDVTDHQLSEAEALISVFEAAGLRVVLDLPKPVFLSPAFRCSDWFNRSNPACAGGFEISRSFLESYRRPVMDAALELARTHPSLGLWDAAMVLCEPTFCLSARAADPAHPLFFDADHLSGYGNDVLYAPFVSFLRQLGQVRARLGDDGSRRSQG